MKIIVKTLNGKQLPLEIEVEWSVLKLKQEIEAKHELKAETLKLIAYGKVLEAEDKAVSEYGIKEGDFIVAMVQKVKPAPKKKEEVKQEEPAQAKPEDAKMDAQPQPTSSPAQA